MPSPIQSMSLVKVVILSFYGIKIPYSIKKISLIHCVIHIAFFPSLQGFIFVVYSIQWCSQDLSTGGAKAREWSDQAGRGCLPPTVGNFWKFVYQTGIFSTLNVIIRGRLCVVAYSTNPLYLFIFVFLFF